MEHKTVQELAEQRRGYKYLNQDRTSPYQNFKYVFRKGKVFKCDDLDEKIENECGAGWNLATLDWILNDTNILDKIIVEFSIPKEAKIIIPKGSNGKFRTNLIRYERQSKAVDIFPEVKTTLNNLKTYKPTNPITAKKLPPKKKLLSILKKVKVRAQVGVRVWDQVRAQVRAQVYCCAYYAVKKFMKLDYEHPVFDLIRLGVMVVSVMGRYKVFGKNGKYLGEIED